MMRNRRSSRAGTGHRRRRARRLIGIGLLQVSLQHKQLVSAEALLKFRQGPFRQQFAVVNNADAAA